MAFQGKRILVGVSGGIAAYRVCEVVSTLAKAGAEVKVILTRSAQEFVTPLSFSTLARYPAYTDEDFWQPHPRPLHIELGEWAEVVLIAPLTANTLAKLAQGLADNLLTNTVLASTCPVLLAPAMNTDMWCQGTVQNNWHQLQAHERYHTVGPSSGVLACDRLGLGRLAAPPQILAHLASLLQIRGKRDLAGQRVLISGGSTQEHWDPVRFIGNPATGKMGIALAQAAHHRGATVTLVHGPLSPEVVALLPEAIQTIGVVDAQAMHRAMVEHFPTTQITVMAAAVADVRPTACSSTKLTKREMLQRVHLAPVPDILADLGSRKCADQYLIGFAAQTGDIESPALAKLQAKHLDAIVANPVDVAGSGFGSETNQAIFLDRHQRRREIPPCTKLAMAHALFDFINSCLNCPSPSP